MRGAVGDTDHLLTRSVMKFCPPALKRCSKPVRKLNVSLLRTDPTATTCYSQRLSRKLDQLPLEPSTEDLASGISTAMLEAAGETIGFAKKRNAEWFDVTDGEVQDLLNRKEALHMAVFNNPSCRRLFDRYQSAKSALRAALRRMKNKWYADKAADLQRFANTCDWKSFYAATKEIYGPRRQHVGCVLSSDGLVSVSEPEAIANCNRWVEHYSAVFHRQTKVSEEAVFVVPVRTVREELACEPSFEELKASIASLANGKSPGPDGVPPELFKAGGGPLIDLNY